MVVWSSSCSSDSLCRCKVSFYTYSARGGMPYILFLYTKLSSVAIVGSRLGHIENEIWTRDAELMRAALARLGYRIFLTGVASSPPTLWVGALLRAQGIARGQSLINLPEEYEVEQIDRSKHFCQSRISPRNWSMSCWENYMLYSAERTISMRFRPISICWVCPFITLTASTVTFVWLFKEVIEKTTNKCFAINKFQFRTTIYATLHIYKWRQCDCVHCIPVYSNIVFLRLAVFQCHFTSLSIFLFIKPLAQTLWLPLHLKLTTYFV